MLGNKVSKGKRSKMVENYYNKGKRSKILDDVIECIIGAILLYIYYNIQSEWKRWSRGKKFDL